ncbi:uncharacterized protein LOC107629024 isoform X2 [Arachis ipaensis]|uniref:uncharacterized protein LOC107629024 isoform X2 n=1 Tax=Arachis ipaensis TaxID=130454 RepID=UPI000A2AF151|nr:uncharacterized protein LOC107629024 isoform X2 [Arachis ipaensis]XP_020973545.1 uncharacterized protein LOC107629024 isoform X2 [Arachis ipaensis]
MDSRTLYLQGVACRMCMEQQDLNGSLQNYIQTNHHCTNLRPKTNFGIKSMPSREATRLARDERALKLANKKLARVAQTQIGTNFTITVDRTALSCTSTKGESLSELLIDKAILVDIINTSPDDMQWNTQIQEERRAARRDKRQKMQRTRQTEDSPIELGISGTQRTMQLKKMITPERANTCTWVAHFMSVNTAMCFFLYDERLNKSYNSIEPKFKLCCNGGKVQLPQLQEASKVLYELLFNNSTKSKYFRDNIRSYNSMFQFISMGAKIDRGITTFRGPPTFILSSENYHLMSSLIPPAENCPKFTQLYVFDT